MMDIPKNKNFSARDAQCNICGGHGCESCSDRGWVDTNSPAARLCARVECKNRIPPAQVAVYCTNQCAMLDA